MTTPETDTILAAVDEALDRGEAGRPDELERAFQELALALSADVPQPGEEFTAAMEARRAEGFPRRDRVSGPLAAALPRRLRVSGRAGAVLSKLRLPRLGGPLLAGAASAALAVVVAVAVIPAGDDGPAGERPPGTDGAPVGGASGGGDEAESLDSHGLLAEREGGASSRAEDDSVAIAPAPPPGGVVPPDPGDGSVAPRRGRREVERAAQLTLAAAADRLDDLAGEVIAVVDRHRGLVISSNVTSGADGATGGSFDLRIPQARLQDALRDLSGLAEVRSRSQTSQDVTRSVASAEERLEEARSDRRGLLRRLERADTEEAADAIRRRLRLVSAEVRRLRDDLAVRRERVALATVSVTLVEDPGAEDEGGGTSDLRNALDDGLEAAEGSLELLLRALGVLIPLALLSGLVWGAARLVRRRRREAALG